MNSRRKIIFGSLLVGALAGAGGSWAIRARAEGIPAAAPLTYSGTLEDPDGNPVTGTKKLTLEVYDAVSAGKLVCKTEQTVDLVRGRFSIPLADACTAEIGKTPDLWVEVKVDDGSIGRTKLAAVPYAVEAKHATRASGLSAKPTIIAATSACAVSTVCNAMATCPAGQIAIGGGCESATNVPGVMIASNPSYTGNAWGCSARNDNATFNLNARVLCVPGP